MHAIAADHLLGRRDTRAIDQAAQATHGHGGGESTLGALFAGHVGGDEAGIRAQLARQGRARLLVDVGQHDLATAGNDHAGSRGAQAGAAAGDDKYIVLDLHERTLLLLDSDGQPSGIGPTGKTSSLAPAGSRLHAEFAQTGC